MASCDVASSIRPRPSFLVAAGERFASQFSDWVKKHYTGKCNVEVVAAGEDADSADAFRAGRGLHPSSSQLNLSRF
jgi:hypothetical protein